jgi:hypothetical protein
MFRRLYNALRSLWNKEKDAIENMLKAVLQQLLSDAQIQHLIDTAKMLAEKELTGAAKHAELLTIVEMFLPGAPAKIINFVVETIVSVALNSVSDYINSSSTDAGKQ